MGLVILLAACGRDIQTQDSVEGGFAETVTMQESRSEFDLHSGNWKEGTLSVSSSHPLYLTEYIAPGQGAEMVSLTNQAGTLYAILGSKLYMLDTYSLYSQDNSVTQRYYLEIYDDVTGEVTQQQITLPYMKKYEDCKKSVEAFDVISDQEFVVFVQCWQGEDTVAYLGIYMDANGNCSKTVDLYPVMQEYGISGQYVFSEAYADTQGCYLICDPFFTGNRETSLLAVDQEGRVIAQIGSERPESSIRFVMKMPDGTAVFETSHQQEDEVRLFGYEAAQGERVYAKARIPQGAAMVVTEDGYLFYGDRMGGLYRWDLAEGVKEFCTDYGVLGIGRNDACFRMMAGRDGEPVLVDYLTGEALLYRMGTERSSQAEALRLVSLTEDCSFISTCAVRYSQTEEDQLVVIDKANTEGMGYFDSLSELENYRTRVMAELAAGKGADIYYVSARDMKVLYESGILADLSGVLQEESRAAIYQGVLDSGMIDGFQVGLAPSAYINALMVRNDLCNESYWNWENVLELYEKDRSNLEYLFVDYFGWLNSSTDILRVFLPSLDASPFVNLEEGTCNFTDPVFIKILEVAREYDRDKYDDMIEKIHENQVAAFRLSRMDFNWFSNLMGQYGEQYRLIGFPTENGNANFWECEYFLVVNRETMHMDQVKQFLNFLFCKDSQYYDIPGFFSVRGDMLEEHIVLAPDWDANLDSERYAYYDNGGGSYSLLSLKAPGISWLEEYQELAENAVPCVGDESFIWQIIEEEVGSLFAGDKDSQSVANLIQNRVQLYLNEQN